MRKIIVDEEEFNELVEFKKLYLGNCKRSELIVSTDTGRKILRLTSNEDIRLEIDKTFIENEFAYSDCRNLRDRLYRIIHEYNNKSCIFRFLKNLVFPLIMPFENIFIKSFSIFSTKFYQVKFTSF